MDPTPEAEFIYGDLSGRITGAAMKVHRSLRPGLDEKLYENALVIELRNQGFFVEQQRAFPVHYDGQLIGTLVPDLIVNELVIVDPKVAECFGDSHVAQMLGYLNITGLKLALLLNFKHAKIQVKRITTA